MDKQLACGCQRSHPHENMDAFCELKTEMARLSSEITHLKAQIPKETNKEVSKFVRRTNGFINGYILAVTNPIKNDKQQITYDDLQNHIRLLDNFYQAASDLINVLGRDGEIDTRNPLSDNLVNALNVLDGLATD